MQRKNQYSASLLVIVALLLLLQSLPAHAAEYGGIGGRPAHSNPSVPNSASWFLYNLAAGQFKEDAVEVQNNAAEKQDLIVYAADSTPSSDGGFALKQKVETMTGVGSWITFYPDPLPGKYKLDATGIIGLCHLQPPTPPTTVKKLAAELEAWCQGKKNVDVQLGSLSKTTIPFVVRIPDTVDVGEHAGGIIIQKKEVEQKAGQGTAIVLTTRVGVRVYETVPGEIVRALTISKFSVVPHPERNDYTIVLGLRNGGNVSLENTNVLHIADSFFKKRNQDIERTMQALPGQELIVNTEWPRPLFGRYRFSATVTYEDGGQTRTLETQAVVIWIIPWRIVYAVGGVILLGLLAWLAWWLWKRKKYAGYQWVTRPVKTGETLGSIAETTGVSWKKLARKNKLKAPYHINVGQQLQVFLPGEAVKEQKLVAPVEMKKTPAPKRTGKAKQPPAKS